MGTNDILVFGTMKNVFFLFSPFILMITIAWINSRTLLRAVGAEDSEKLKELERNSLRRERLLQTLATLCMITGMMYLFSVNPGKGDSLKVQFGVGVMCLLAGMAFSGLCVMDRYKRIRIAFPNLQRTVGALWVIEIASHFLFAIWYLVLASVRP